MGSKIRNGLVRLVIMVPQVVEFEFSGNDKLLKSISEHMIETKFPDKIQSATGEEFYTAKLMESHVAEPEPERGQAQTTAHEINEIKYRPPERGKQARCTNRPVAPLEKRHN